MAWLVRKRERSRSTGTESVPGRRIGVIGRTRCAAKTTSATGMRLTATKWPPISIGVRNLHSLVILATFLTRDYHVDNSYKFSFTKRTRKHSFFLGRNNRSSESREGDLERHTSEGCFWLCLCPSLHDQSTFPRSGKDFLVNVSPGLDGQ